MKLQIAFDITDLNEALQIADATQEYADVFEVGTLLIYKYGVEAVKQFKEKFPNKIILVDAKIIDQSKDAITLLAQAGADWITLLAGTRRDIIHNACSVAHEYGKKVMLDLVDASSLGQSALEAKSLGVDALLFHKPQTEDADMIFLEKWDMVKGNTQVPIFITANITRENIAEILSVGASGVVIGKSITGSDNPLEEAAYFSSLLNHKD